jgi:hypothetical protein
MIKLVFCLHRKSNLSREEFQAYWRIAHRSLVIARSQVLRINQYSQLHTLTIPALAGLASSRGCPPEYDGIAEASFDSVDDLLAPATDPEAAKAAEELIADERTFIDHSASPIFLVRHDLVIDNIVGGLPRL